MHYDFERWWVACTVASTGVSLTGDLVPVIVVCPEPNTYSLFVDFIKMLVGCRLLWGGRSVKEGGLLLWRFGRCAQVKCPKYLGRGWPYTIGWTQTDFGSFGKRISANMTGG